MALLPIGKAPVIATRRTGPKPNLGSGSNQDLRELLLQTGKLFLQLDVAHVARVLALHAAALAATLAADLLALALLFPLPELPLTLPPYPIAAQNKHSNAKAWTL